MEKNILKKGTYSESHSVVSDSTRLLCPWDSLGKNTGVGCHFFLQGIFPTQGSNPGLLQYRQILYHVSHQGSPPKKITKSLCYTTEINTMLQNNYTSIKNKNK